MAKAAGFMPRNSIYVLPNNKGLYHTAPPTNATTARHDDGPIVYL